MVSFILKQMGIPDHLTCFFRSLYAGQEATVRTGHGTTDRFQIGKCYFQTVYMQSDSVISIQVSILFQIIFPFRGNNLFFFLGVCLLNYQVNEVAQSCPTLCDPMDCSLPGFSIHGIFQDPPEWIAISFSRGSSCPKDRTWDALPF